MDVESIQETAHSPYYGPWSAWSPWRTICRQGIVRWQTRERTRQVGETWSRRTHHENCDPLELPIAGTIWLQSVVDGPWETVTNTWTATQREYRTVTLIVDILEATPWKMAVLPTMYLGDRVHLDWRALAQLSAVKSHRATFDGEPLEDDEFVPPGDLLQGHHVLDLDVETGGEARRFQIAFATAARFAAWFPEPHVELKLPKAGRSNGAKFAVMAVNNSPEEVHVRPTVDSVPAGWKAVFLDESPVKLAPGRQREFTVQVEAMTDAAIRQSPQPLTVGFRSIGIDDGLAETACATCVLQVTGDDKAIKGIEAASAERMKRHRPLLDIPIDASRSKKRRGRHQAT
jgi:hypothetical protein